MNICMVAYTFYESDGRVRKYAEALAKRGDDVDVIVLGRAGQPGKGTLNNVTIYRIQKRLINEKSKWTYLLRLILFFVKSFFVLARRHLRRPYHLVHVHSVPDFEVFAALVPKLLGAKIILDIHDIVPELYASKFGVSTKSTAFKALVRMEKACASFSDHVIIANHVWHETITARSVKKEKCTAILNYPDTRIFSVREKKKNTEKFIMLYPGTLTYHQGLDVAIKALALIEKQAPHAELHIYGEGNAKEELVRLAAGLNLAKKVLFCETRSYEHIGQIMANADLGIVPKRASTFGNEAFSTKIPEFMAAGVPVIVSDTRIDKYYFDESQVIFFKSEDCRDLARRLLMAIGDRDLRSRIARNAAEYAKRNSWELKKGEYFDLVDRLLQGCKDEVVSGKSSS